VGLSATVRFGSPPDPPFAASVDTVNRKFLDQYGAVYLLKTFSSWGMGQNLTDAEIVTAFDLLDGSGLNAVSAAPCGVNIQADWATGQYKNAAGNNYFTGTPFQSSLGSAWSTMDLIVSTAEAHGMMVLFTWFVSFTTTGIRPAIEAATNAQMRTFGQSIATRYGDAPNIVWHVMVDDGMNPDTTGGRRIDYLMRGITETQPFPRLQTVEPALNGTAGFEYITGQGTDPTGYQWFHVSADSLYSYQGNTVEQFDGMYPDHTTYPVWDSEPPYADSTHYSTTESVVRQQTRERTICVFLRNGCGINFGFEDWMRFGLTGFYTNGLEWDEVPGSAKFSDMKNCWAVVDELCRDVTWVPSSTFVTTGVGTGDTKAGVGSSSTRAAAYFPSNRTVVVDTTVLSGTGNCRLRWFDPMLGTYSTVAASEAQQSGRSVSYPGNHSDGTADYVLVADLV